MQYMSLEIVHFFVATLNILVFTNVTVCWISLTGSHTGRNILKFWPLWCPTPNTMFPLRTLLIAALPLLVLSSNPEQCSLQFSIPPSKWKKTHLLSIGFLDTILPNPTVHHMVKGPISRSRMMFNIHSLATLTGTAVPMLIHAKCVTSAIHNIMYVKCYYGHDNAL